MCGLVSYSFPPTLLLSYSPALLLSCSPTLLICVLTQLHFQFTMQLTRVQCRKINQLVLGKAKFQTCTFSSDETKAFAFTLLALLSMQKVKLNSQSFEFAVVGWKKMLCHLLETLFSEKLYNTFREVLYIILQRLPTKFERIALVTAPGEHFSTNLTREDRHMYPAALLWCKRNKRGTQPLPELVVQWVVDCADRQVRFKKWRLATLPFHGPCRTRKEQYFENLWKQENLLAPEIPEYFKKLRSSILEQHLSEATGRQEQAPEIRGWKEVRGVYFRTIKQSGRHLCAALRRMPLHMRREHHYHKSTQTYSLKNYKGETTCKCWGRHRNLAWLPY